MKFFASCIMSELRNEADLSKSCEYCKELADFSEAIKGKGLSSKEYALAINLFSFVYREKHHVESLINHNIAEHLIKTSEEESIEISKMLIPTTDNENKLKHFTENELIEELKRREKERIATK